MAILAILRQLDVFSTQDPSASWDLAMFGPMGLHLAVFTAAYVCQVLYLGWLHAKYMPVLLTNLHIIV